MTLKILGGEFRGRLLKAPKGDQTRPTKSLLRKAVFDILQPIIQEAVFLDLFAGSGAMGIEALSRGAKQAIFVDSHPQSIRCIKENLTLLDLTSYATVIQSDAIKALGGFECDIIYADPPYHKLPLYLELIQWVDRHPLLRRDGVLFVEAPSSSSLEKGSLSLVSLKAQPPRRYGDSMLYLYLKR